MEITELYLKDVSEDHPECDLAEDGFFCRMAQLHSCDSTPQA